MKRKLFAALLALVMILSLLPTALLPKTAVAESGTIDQTIVEGGAILHCFDWSYNEIRAHLQEIKDAGYVAVQTSPVQQPKDYNSEWTGGDQWWKLYQPLGFTIANGDSWLGTKAELTELCRVAEETYGIKVIVDIVANHLANKTGGGGWAQVNENIDPELYKEEYFHTSTAGVNDGSRANMTQNQMGMPDLNTANEFVQQKVYNLLVECVDCGVDGFRFDAAKHIELPNDPVGSDFWSAILNGVDKDGTIQGIRAYAASKGQSVFIYGESLSGEAGQSWVDEYTSYMALTDSDYGGRIRNALNGTNAGMLGDGRYVRCEDARGNVVWVESHDTYEDGGSTGLTSDQIIKGWAIVGARADSTALYFARPSDTMGTASSDITWQSTAVAEVNKFKTRYVGMSEYMHSDYNSKVAWVERGGNGVVISKLDGAGSVYLYVCQMQDGNYKDQVTGNMFTVVNGMISGTVGPSGVAVVYDEKKDATNGTPTQSSYVRTTPLYLVPNDNWKSDGARFAMYVNDTNGHSAWVDMTEVADGVFEAELPVGDWTNVIFLRMNPAFTENRWNTNEDPDNNKPVWNQTADLGHAFTGNCYTINEGSWDAGAWGTYNPYAGYYLVGNMNGWAVNQNYRLTFNPNASAKEYSIKADLNQFSSFKIVYSADGEQRTTWYPEGEGTDYSDITAAGTYDIYFRPDKDGGNDWYKNCIYVDKANAQTSTTNDNAGFYLVGTMTNWKVKSDYKLEEEDGIYSIDKHLSVMDQLKVVYSVDGKETTIWYPDPGPNYGAEDDTRIIGSGVYHISFRPDFGGKGWYKDCIKVSGCPVIVNIVGNSDLITWSLYKSEEGMTDWEEFRPYGQPEMTKLEDGDNVVPVGMYVGIEATTRDGSETEFVFEYSYTNSDGEEASGFYYKTVSVFRRSRGPLGEGPVTITLTVTKVAEEPAFDNCSVVLSGQIGMNFYMTIPEGYEAGTLNVTIGNRETTAEGAQQNDGRYKYTCYLTSVEMADQITATYSYTVGEETKTISKNTSIQGYLNKIIENKENDPEFTRAHDLAKALWTYGYYAQYAVTDGPNHEQMDNENVNVITTYPSIGEEFVADVHRNESEVTKITYSLSLDSETALNIYLTPAENVEFTNENFSVKKGNEDYSHYKVEKVGARYRVKITGIGAHQLGTGFNIEVGSGENKTTISNVSAVTIVKKYLANNTIKTETKKAATALYYYYQAAIEY